MGKMYGNLTNRLMENQNNIPTIEVGMGVTEYLYSDRNAYEVIEVISQKHIIIREYDHKASGGDYSNEWNLVSNPQNRTKEIVYRYNNWYEKYTDRFTSETKYERIKLRFGVAEYYYDYTF